MNGKPLRWLRGEVKTPEKKTSQTPQQVIEDCRRRLKLYEASKP